MANTGGPIMAPLHGHRLRYDHPMLPSLEYALHPYWPVRLGFRKALKITNPSVARLLEKTNGITLAGPRVQVAQLRELRDVLRRGVPGDVVEFGVHRGGSAAVLAYALLDEPDRQLHLFDRWGDLPEPTDEDGFRKETHRRADRLDKIAELHDTLATAKRLVESSVGFPKDRVTYYQGWFDDTIKDYPGNPIAYASVDTDYYESTVPVLEMCSRYASPQAVFFIDDYATWPGARQATHEFLERTPRKTQLSHLPMGNAVIHFLD
jgi:hypothetical protein